MQSQLSPIHSTRTGLNRFGVLLALCFIAATFSIASAVAQQGKQSDMSVESTVPLLQSETAIEQSFHAHIQPLIASKCLRCHNPENAESGVRVDRLDGKAEDRHLNFLQEIRHQIEDEAMPPEDEPQFSQKERKRILEWIDAATVMTKSRKVEKNGSVRRLTVAQYRNTLAELLGIDEDLSDLLPPDAVSKDGFLNDRDSMVLSPLLLEAYFEIAEKALDLCIVDEDQRPTIQNFRMDLGEAINQKPSREPLILGASNLLLRNDEFVVTELTPNKPFDFEPFRMQTSFRFQEGYQGNSTVRGWKEFDGIHHAVFACMRGNRGYPLGLAYQAVPEGLLLRPAIPTLERLGIAKHGPQANFKVSLRELPNAGRFRVTVNAASYDDGILLENNAAMPDPGYGASVAEGVLVASDPDAATTITVQQPGVYQADVYIKDEFSDPVKPDASKLAEGLIGRWSFNGNANAHRGPSVDETNTAQHLTGQLAGNSRFVDSPFGQAVTFNGKDSGVVIARHEAMNVGKDDFTISAWIHPTKLKKSGVVGTGGYPFVHGWLLDMPGGNGVLRIETAKAGNISSGTVRSRVGVIHNNKWQHVAAVVERGENQTVLYVNGYEVGRGTIDAENLDNPKADMHIGRVPNSQIFNGKIDEVMFYRRALAAAEIQALVEPGKQFQAPPVDQTPQPLSLQIAERNFSANLRNPAFALMRLPAGRIDIQTEYPGDSGVSHVVLTRLEEDSNGGKRFLKFEKRRPRVGLHMGLRRDCGSTLNQVGVPQTVRSTEFANYVFEDAISNFPNSNVQKGNTNYLAGLREIGVRSEYTDGRDTPRLLIRSVEFEGPLYETWPPQNHQRIFIKSANKNRPPAYAREIIQRFASRAYRRPITEQEERSLLNVWQDSFSTTSDFNASIKDALVVVLTSPQFLFLVENSLSPKPEILDDYELASKLSYFLWNAAPDRQLLERAKANTLRQSIDSEFQRMIVDPRFDDFMSEFASQWLTLDKFDVVETDNIKFEKLTRHTKRQLRSEPVEFLKHVIRANLSVRTLVKSDFIVANEVVAAYYDLPNRTDDGYKFHMIQHENENLGGLLSQAAILAGLSNGRESNPVKRGAWFARKIIAEPPADPPPNVPDLSEDNSHLPLRKQLELHRNQKGCVKCHEGIDPWGIPFEEFDAGGLFIPKSAEEVESVLPDRTKVTGVNGLRNCLANDHLDKVAFSFLKHLAQYASGRTLTYTETEQLRKKSVALRGTDYKMQDLFLYVIHSPVFMEK